MPKLQFIYHKYVGMVIIYLIDDGESILQSPDPRSILHKSFLCVFVSNYMDRLTLCPFLIGFTFCPILIGSGYGSCPPYLPSQQYFISFRV
ncbi:unnamed protein product [Prunus brigantina]